MPQPQSKLSEALASTLLRFKEIDRDTIESLCKRAATLEHQVTQNTADINRETALRQMAQERGEEVTKLKAELSAWYTAENRLSNAYIRLRVILDAINTCPGTTSEAIWEHTEARAQGLVKSHTQLQWALRNLLAHTRDANDRHNGDGEGWQSDELEEAIKQADALVGIDATDTFPIADDVLYRRIEELEVRLSKHSGSPLKNCTATRCDVVDFIKDGEVRVQIGNLSTDGLSTKPQLWSEKHLYDLVKWAITEQLKPGGIIRQACSGNSDNGR